MNQNSMKRTACHLAVVSSMAASASVQAQISPETQRAIDELKQQVEQLRNEVKILKSTGSTGPSAAPPAGSATATSVPAAPIAAAGAGKDYVSLTEGPGGWRLIDTESTTLGLYGLIDLTVATASSGGPNANANAATGGVTDKRWTGLDVSWMNGNRWGLTGSHVLDKDSKTRLVMRLESEFELPTGNFDGGFTAPILFNRDAWIGIESPTIGKLTIGRQDTLGRDVNMIWANPFSKAANSYDEGGWMNNQVMYQLMEYSGSPTGNRWDSSVVWKKAWGHLFTYVGYQFAGLQNGSGTDTVDTGKGLKGTQQALGVGYNSDDDMWHASASATHANYDHYGKKVYSIGGNFRPVKWLRMNGGVYHADIGQPAVLGDRKDNAWTVSAQIYPGGKLDYALAYHHINARNAGQSGGNTLQPFDLTNAITSAASGTWNTLYGAAFYRWDRQVDLYLAFDYSKTGGGYKSSYFQGHNKFNQLGIGARYFF